MNEVTKQNLLRKYFIKTHILSYLAKVQTLIPNLNDLFHFNIFS